MKLTILPVLWDKLYNGYKKYIGTKVKLPFVDREIPVIADEHVDQDFGTGWVKVTPAHDPNDFAIGKRNNLKQINIMNKRMNWLF